MAFFRLPVSSPVLASEAAPAVGGFSQTKVLKSLQYLSAQNIWPDRLLMARQWSTCCRLAGVFDSPQILLSTALLSETYLNLKLNNWKTLTTKYKQD